MEVYKKEDILSVKKMEKVLKLLGWWYSGSVCEREKSVTNFFGGKKKKHIFSCILFTWVCVMVKVYAVVVKSCWRSEDYIHFERES